MSDITDIAAYTVEELSGYLTAAGEPAYRAKQLYEWLHVKKAADYGDMTNLSKALRERLEKEAPLDTPAIVRTQASACDGTRKYLMRLSDGECIESVLLRYDYGNSVCISSQVGCRMGCRFCASTMDGLSRSMRASEMIGQIHAIESDINERVDHVVVMGMGEPLDNYDELVRFIRIMSDTDGEGLSQRNITVSTCGIVPRIYDLAKEGFAITLALSLHAPTQEKRLKLMPVAKKYPLPEVMKAMRDYFETTHRRITFEYALIEGENTGVSEADELARLLRGFPGHINLIPVNPVEGKSYASGRREGILAFKDRLEKKGINVTIRRELGRDIDGACGQLRRRYL